jgi:hypothetical protein
MIRRAGMNTSIGRSILLDGLMNVYSYPHTFCASACAYAFLGGVVRSYDRDNVYGIHRFGKETGSLSGDDAQIVSGIVAKYIQSMDVDLSVFELASTKAYEGDIYWVPTALGEQMRIIYDPTGRTSFVIEQRNGGTVASFQVKSYTREFEGVIACSQGQRLLILFDHDGVVPNLLRSAKGYPAQFSTPQGRLDGFATYVSRNGPNDTSRGAMMFSIPGLDVGAFAGQGMALLTIDNPTLAQPPKSVIGALAPNTNFLNRLQWYDAVSAFSFSMQATNGPQTLPIVLGNCR